MLILCGLTSANALGQSEDQVKSARCTEAYKNCSACQDRFQGRNLISVSYGNQGCIATDNYRRKATDPGASEQLKACQKCLDGLRPEEKEKKEKLPIIFLPGVAGTELRALVESSPIDQLLEAWPFSEAYGRVHLGFDVDGKTPVSQKTRKIQVGPILANRGSPLNFYGGLLDYLSIQKGYVGHNQLTPPDRPKYQFLFGYDWRLDNASHFSALDNLVREALTKNPNPGKVILMAHSMGGYIARAYILSSPERAAKVASLITIGTPYWGAPKPYYGAASGYTFGNPTVRQELMKLLIQNWPAAYQLMPNYPFISDSTYKRMLTPEESSRIRYKGFTGVMERFIFQDEYAETSDNVWSFNQELVKLARDFNKPLGTKGAPKPLPPGVKHYVIIGTGVKTLTMFLLRDAAPNERHLALDGRKVVLEPYFSDGDGTVPLNGSEISTATSTYYVPYVERWGPDVSSAHGDLPANKTVQEIIGQILDGNPPDPNKYKYQYATGLMDLEPGADFTLHSDAHLSITDINTGRKLGFNTQGGIDETLPSGTFLSIEEAEYASIADINRPLLVRVTGIREGKFTLDVNIKRPSGAAIKFSYREIAVKKGTIAQVTLTPGQVSALPAMNITTDGRTTSVAPSMGTDSGPVVAGPTGTGNTTGSTDTFFTRRENTTVSPPAQILRYFGSPSEDACRSSCSAAQGCVAYTFVRPGGYQVGDPPMCYLMSSLGPEVKHSCCVTGVRHGSTNGSGNTSPGNDDGSTCWAWTYRGQNGVEDRGIFRLYPNGSATVQGSYFNGRIGRWRQEANGREIWLDLDNTNSSPNLWFRFAWDGRKLTSGANFYVQASEATQVRCSDGVSGSREQSGCSDITGRWTNTIPEGTTTWEIKRDNRGGYQAVEYGMGNAQSTSVTLSGNRLRIEWVTGGIKGYYEWELSENCQQSTRGRLVWTQGLSGSRDSTLKRQ